MVQIPAGCFAMGDSYGGGAADELPVHNVCISAFAIDSTEVTNADYLECVADNGCTAPSSFSSRGRPDYYGDAAFSDYPVIWVTWDQARGYCSWAGKRLPTEAEWEYAARGGLAMQRYPNGNEIACEDANYARSSPLDPCWNYNGLDNDTHPVASYPANGYGVYDMAGNAFEWVNDRYLANYYESSPVNDPQGPTTGSARVYRGGAFTNVAAAVRVSDRNNRAPAGANYNIGFRCAQ
jgi:formylglycine-generating enzyme required for sulfatase activity